jgi:hypothetical protein
MGQATRSSIRSGSIRGGSSSTASRSARSSMRPPGQQCRGGRRQHRELGRHAPKSTASAAVQTLADIEGS